MDCRVKPGNDGEVCDEDALTERLVCSNSTLALFSPSSCAGSTRASMLTQRRPSAAANFRVLRFCHQRNTSMQ
jgi:hypothetical protein